jgi:hypothetical protein
MVEKIQIAHKGRGTIRSAGVLFTHDFQDRCHDFIWVWFAEIVAITAIGRTVSLSRQGSGCGVQPLISTLTFDDLIEHIGGSSTGNVFVYEQNPAGLFQRFQDNPCAIKGIRV